MTPPSGPGLELHGQGRTIESDEADALRAAYAADGAVVVRGLFSDDELALADRALQANIRDWSPLAQRASSADDGAFMEDFCSWDRIPDLEAFVRLPHAAALAGWLSESERIRLYHDHVLVRAAGTGQTTPWHQDQPYYNVDGRQNASMWVPLEPVSIDHGIRFVAGSHLGPWYLPRSFMDGAAKWFSEDELAECPDIEADPQRYPVVRWALEPGDAVFFHMLSLHAASGTSPDTARRVVSVRYLGDDMTFAPKPWRTSPPFTGLDRDLAPGASLDHPRFPILWER